MISWVRHIGEIYRLNDERLAVRKEQADFSVEQASLSTMLKRFSDQIDAELASTTLHELQRKILRSACRNWERYIVFLDQPQVPMDNNTAERLLRPVALGRKNYYGSHATWSGKFAALCLSIFQSANLHHLNAEAYMRYILD